MKVVLFGSAEGPWSENPHAALWPPLVRELKGLGHKVVFFERAGPKPAALDGADLIPYPDWKSIQGRVTKELADADAAIITTGSADVAAATRSVLDSNARVRCFYHLDPAAVIAPECTPSQQRIPPGGLGGFDVVLSYAGGRALTELKQRLGARHVVPLYGWANPDTCHQVPPDPRYRADLAYLGRWTSRSEASLEALLLEPARRRPDLRFTVGGAQRPPNELTAENIRFVPDLPAPDHGRFYCSSRIALVLADRGAADMGYCPPGQMFEAAGCGVPVLTDDWEGLDYFFEAGREILVAHTTGHVMDALALSPERLGQIGRAGRDRVLSAHTAARRALDLENILEAAISLPVEQSGAGRK